MLFFSLHYFIFRVLCPPIVDSKHINKSNNNSNNFNSNNNFTEKTRENKVVTFADTIEIETTKPPSPSKIVDEGIVDPDQGDRENMIMMMSTNGDHKNGSSNNGNNANDYRNNWKKQRDTENKNTMVFNFLNTQKDVTHIENDGLDLSQRKKKNFFSKAKVRPYLFIQMLVGIFLSYTNGKIDVAVRYNEFCYESLS